MKLSEIEIPSEHLAGLNRLLSKMTASAATSRDSSDLMRRTFGYEVKAIDESARSLRVIASSTAIDSYDEIVKQDWDLDRYRKNPVVLYAHNSVGLCGPAEDTLPIGHASDVAVVKGQLEATLNFVSAKANPLAEKVWRGVVEGSLRAVSVGFRPGDTTTEYDDNGEEITTLSQNELFEISVVPIPANPEAVARDVERNKSQTKRLAAKAVEQTNPAPADEDIAMKEELEKAKTALEAKSAECTALEAKHETAIKKLGDELAEAKKALETAQKAAEKSSHEVASLEVDALVGKKIAPAEKAEFLELRLSNPTLFAKMVEKRPDISSLTEDVVGDEKSPRNKSSDSGGASKRLADKAHKAAR